MKIWTRAGCLAAMTTVFVAVCRDLSVPAAIVGSMACIDRVLFVASVVKMNKAEIA